MPLTVPIPTQLNDLTDDVAIVNPVDGQVLTYEAGSGKWHGAANGSADKNYVHPQGSAASTWNVAHNLGKRPAITIVTSAGDVVMGEIHYVDDNNVTLTFSSAFSGKAYCN